MIYIRSSQKINIHRKMKRLIFFFILSLITSTISAQHKNNGFTPERFQAELEQYITKKACLSPKEAAAFFPLYAEMRRKQRSIHNEMRSLKRVKPTTDAECKKNILQTEDLQN